MPSSPSSLVTWKPYQSSCFMWRSMPYIYIYIYTYIYIHIIYIYIYTEREREREMYVYTCIYSTLYIYIYIHIHCHYQYYTCLARAAGRAGCPGRRAAGAVPGRAIKMWVCSYNNNNNDNDTDIDNNNNAVQLIPIMMITMTMITITYQCLWTKTLLRKMIHTGTSAFGAPNQGLESSFCCWTAGQGLAQKECFCSQTPV